MMGNKSSSESKEVSQQTQPPPSKQVPSLTPQNSVQGDKRFMLKALEEMERSLSPQLPHNWEHILKDSDRNVDTSSPDKLIQHLHAGLYLNGRKKKYWVEKRYNANCFMVFANGLSIIWGDHPEYWYLHIEKTSDHGVIIVAQLRSVCWLEVNGNISTALLTPRVTYQVSYIIKMETSAYGWSPPVYFKLTLPDGTEQKRQEDLRKYPKEKWHRILVGEFQVSSEKLDEGEQVVKFSINGSEGTNWKEGLVIQGAIIEPKLPLNNVV